MESLQITGYEDENFHSKVAGPYKLMLNPESLKWDRKVEYSNVQPLGTSNSSPEYQMTPSGTLSFEFVIDCSGVVDSSRTDMVTEMSNFENIVYRFNGEIHKPNYVTIQWGNSIEFNGVLQSLDTSYTLFRGDGTPIRAKVNVTFLSYIAPATLKKLDNRQSPDVTHIINVVAGDSLPRICRSVLGDDSFTVPVAKFNKLNKFRHLNQMKLIIPPIINT